MLISELYKSILEYAINYYKKCGNCDFCTRDNRVCSGSCEKCLSELHWNNEIRTNYNCKKLTSLYVCRFFNKYCSEIYYALNCNFIKNRLNKNAKLNILSFGCGPLSDYIAFDYFRNSYYPTKIIKYGGIDITKEWVHINNFVKNNKKETDEIIIKYEDVFEKIKEKPIRNVNVLVIQNLFSNLNKKQDTRFIENFENFLEDLVKNIVNCRAKNLVIIINDVNSSNCARDKWIYSIINKFTEQGVQFKYQINYFKNDKCKHEESYWVAYKDSNWIFDPYNNEDNYQEGLNKVCTGVQLLIKIGEDDNDN